MTERVGSVRWHIGPKAELEPHIGIDFVRQPRTPNRNAIDRAGDSAEEIIPQDLRVIGEYIEAGIGDVRQLDPFRTHRRIAIRSWRSIIDEERHVEADVSGHHTRIDQFLPIANRHTGRSQVTVNGIIVPMIGRSFPTEGRRRSGVRITAINRKPIGDWTVWRSGLAIGTPGSETVFPDLGLRHQLAGCRTVEEFLASRNKDRRRITARWKSFRPQL